MCINFEFRFVLAIASNGSSTLALARVFVFLLTIYLNPSRLRVIPNYELIYIFFF